MTKSTITKDGTISTCKECTSKRRKEVQVYEVSVIEKSCCQCGLTKTAKEFPRARQLPSGLYSWCKSCVKEKRESYNINENVSEKRKKRRKEDPIWRDKIAQQKKDSRLRNFPVHMWRSARTKAKNKGMEFSIIVEDIIIPEMCPILQVPLVFGTKDHYEFSPSLDRKDNTKGYIPGNIVVMSKKANTMKNCATKEELVLFADWIYKEFK